MPFFKRRKEELKKKDAAFRRKIAEANRRITNLDFQIADFKRKYQNLQMRGREAQSVAELERMLRDMHMQAEQIQTLLNECEVEHLDYIKMVDGMIEEYQATLGAAAEQKETE